MSDYQSAYSLGYAASANPSSYDESQVGMMFVGAYQSGYHDGLEASGQGYSGPAVEPYSAEQAEADRQAQEQYERFVCWVVGCEREDPHTHEETEPEVEFVD
jgi:hypothetical protein